MRDIKKIFFLSVILVSAVYVLSPFLDVIVFALVLAYLAYPVHDKARLAIGDSLSALTITLLCLLLIITPIVYVVGLIVRNIMSLYHVLINSSLYAWLLSNAKLYTVIESQVESLLVKASSYAITMPMFFLKLFVMLTLFYYFLKDGHKLGLYITNIFNKQEREIVKTFFRVGDETLNAILRGHFLTALIVASIAGLVFILLQLEHAFWLILLVLVVSIIPITGPIIVILPLGVYNVFMGEVTIGLILIALSIFLSVVDDLIRPRVAGKYVKMHPEVMLIGFLAGPLVFGAEGFILGPILLGFIKTGLDTFKEYNK